MLMSPQQALHAHGVDRKRMFVLVTGLADIMGDVWSRFTAARSKGVMVVA